MTTCMVSYMASPELTTPPGEFMYMLICITDYKLRCSLSSLASNLDTSQTTGDASAYSISSIFLKFSDIMLQLWRV